MKNKKTPDIRFKGFTDDWEQRKFSDVIKTRRGLTYKPTDVTEIGIRVLRSSNINEDCFEIHDDDVFVNEDVVNIPYAKNGDILITSANGSSRLIGKHAIIHDIQEKSIVHGGFMLIASSDEPEFINASMSSPWYTKFINVFVSGGNGAIGNLSKADLDEQHILIPCKEERKKIGSYFSNLDNLITLHQRKLEKLKNFKKAMLEKMFPKNGEKTPEIRFQGFTDDWEQRKLGNVTEELSDYDNLSSGLPLLTSARTGIMYQSDYRGNCTTDNEKTLFSVVPLNACTYRHMSDDSTFHININTLEKGLVSREYPVFVGKKSDLRYIVRYINSSNSFIKFCTEQKKGGTRTRLYYKTLCKYQMLFPSLDEQHIIANYFEALDNLITLHQRKLEKLQQIKKAMLEKMFV